VTFEVVDVDQLQLDENAPRTLVRAIFINAPLIKELPYPVGTTPSFLFVGLSCTNQRSFDKLVGDYESLLGRISVPAPGAEPDEP
jgi:hypothetical protein